MTREEAIKKIRRMSLPKETMEILEALALDLAESEDEKAYKRIEQLIRLFTSEAEKTYLLAYLEKQKEQKSAGWSKGDEGYLQLVLRLVTSDLGENNPTVRWLKAIPGRINPQPRQEQPEVEGVVHHSLEAHWIVIDDKKKLATVLKKFSEGTKVKIMIAKEDEK